MIPLFPGPGDHCYCGADDWRWYPGSAGRKVVACTVCGYVADIAKEN